MRGKSEDGDSKVESSDLQREEDKEKAKVTSCCVEAGGCLSVWLSVWLSVSQEPGNRALRKPTQSSCSV